MTMKNGYCPNCKIKFDYFTTHDFIIHAPCNQRVGVEPCDPEEDIVIVEPEQGE